MISDAKDLRISDIHIDVRAWEGRASNIAIISPHELPHFDAERGRHCQSLDSDMLANNETSVIDEICD